MSSSAYRAFVGRTFTSVFLADVQSRLKARGITATPGQTLREIATGNGYEGPFELVEIIRGNSPK